MISCFAFEMSRTPSSARPSSSASSARGRSTTSATPRGRVRRMRGRLGIGTERVVHSPIHLLFGAYPQSPLPHLRDDGDLGGRGRSHARGQPVLERERPRRADEAKRAADEPEEVRVVLKEVAAAERSDDPADLPGLARERHIAAEVGGRGGIGWGGGVGRGGEGFARGG